MATASPKRFLYKNTSQLLTLAAGRVPRRGAAMAELSVVRRGALLTEGSLILAAGPAARVESQARRLKAAAVDCRGGVIMPGFVDSHTHLIFAANRVEDYIRRLAGANYAEIAAQGGGIALSARQLRRASPQDIEEQARGFLIKFAAHGTTTLEVKTGYGLDWEGEIKSLKILQRLRAATDLELAPTFLPAHAVPAQFALRRPDLVQQIITQWIPQVAALGLAEFIDVFCERGAFTLEECRKVLQAGARHGLTPRVHAEQLTRSGASQLAVQMNAASADHLDHVNASDVRRLARSSVACTLLPGANFHLAVGRYAPARRLIDTGAAVTVATDFNPGTSPTLNMQFILSLACNGLRMTPAEAITAATINGAYALGRAHRIGSLEPGKQADFAVMAVSDYRELPYYFAMNHCVMTVKSGRIIYSQPAGG